MPLKETAGATSSGGRCDSDSSTPRSSTSSWCKLETIEEVDNEKGRTIYQMYPGWWVWNICGPRILHARKKYLLQTAILCRICLLGYMWFFRAHLCNLHDGLLCVVKLSFWPGSEKNVRPQCNATFTATAQSSTIVENWYSFFLKTVAKCNLLIYTFRKPRYAQFWKKEVWNAFLTLIFWSLCHTFRTFFF